MLFFENKDATPIETASINKDFQGSTYNQKRLWYPPAIQHFPKMPVAGVHDFKYPQGLVVHFTAGWHTPGPTIDYGSRQGYLYDCVGPDGIVRQANSLNQWGHHAGQSRYFYKGKMLQGLSRFCRGLEITSAGLLDKNKVSWFKARIDDDKCRFVKAGGTIKQGGWYEKFTGKQEDALIKYALWLKWNNPAVFDFDLVVGHEEISLSGKTDPGGSLSMDMNAFRALLKAEWLKLDSSR